MFYKIKQQSKILRSRILLKLLKISKYFKIVVTCLFENSLSECKTVNFVSLRLEYANNVHKLN